MYELLHPKEILIENKSYIISKFPAVEGREIITNYPLSAIPKVGDYKRNEELMLKLMGYVAVAMPNNATLRLNSQAMINNHVPSWEILMKIEAAMMEYNCSFFQNGSLSNFLNDSIEKLPKWISKILMDLSAQSSQTVAQPSTNSEPSIL